MPIPFPHYAKIKDNYCVAYFGHNREFLVQLKILRPSMEMAFPGVRVYLACRDDSYYLLEGEPRVIKRSEFEKEKGNFAYIRELTCDMKVHPVEEFMSESSIPYPAPPEIAFTSCCVLYTGGTAPVRPLSAEQVEKALEYIRKNGGNPLVNASFAGFDWVVGTECEELYLAASLGLRTTLIPTGLGEGIYRKMFPKGEILRV